MYRRIAVVTAVCALALPASAVAAEPGATAAGGVTLEPAALLKVTSVKASRSGRTVTAKIRWDRGLLSRRAQRERFTVRLITGPARQRRVVASTSRRVPRGTSETVRFRLGARNARRVKSSSRVIATASQQFDGTDAGGSYEHNRVAIAAMKGKRPFASAAAKDCNPTAITPGADLSGCVMPGVNLAGADLSNVNFASADLEVSNLAGANLRTANLTATNLIGASLAGAAMNAAEQQSLTFPDDGEQIAALVATAKTSVDVVIYDFGGPNIVGQPSNPGTLMKAVQNGVNVRVIVNSGNKGCASLSAADQAICLGGATVDGIYATEAALKWASQNPAPGKSAGRYRVQFSSQNFQITHQKSILIDTSDSSGNPLTATQMVPTSRVMVSTGNLSSYQWADYLYCKSKAKSYPYNCTDYEVENADYLTNPAATCPQGKASGCADEWSARDFAIKVTDPALMERIAAVYSADQACQDWNSAPVYRALQGSTLPDSWANGTLLADGSGYPPMADSSGKANPAFYGGNPNPALQAQPQGNSRQRQLDLVASAKKTLVVYNEEMADPDIVNGLVDAAGRGVSVRVVMASPFTNGKPTPKGESGKYGTYYFSYLVANGVKVNFLDSDGALYIHAKAIVADGVNGFIGSENFGYSSMNFNRELGLTLTNSTDPNVKPTAPSLLSVDGIASIMTAFEKDWGSPGAVAWTAATPTQAPYSTYPKPPYPALPPQSGFGDFNLACIAPEGGDRYQPVLPTRVTPKIGPQS